MQGKGIREKGISLSRVASWAEVELHEFLLQRQAEPFVWSCNDCCLFPADAIQAMTGVDLAEDFRGKYHSEETAFALIREVTGGETVADAAAWCAAKYGLQEWEQPLFARRGDLVVAENEGRLIAGLVHLSGKHVVTVAESGLVRLPLRSVVRAWRVG